MDFPLALTDLADLLPIRTAPFVLQDNREMSGAGSGQILQADLAPQLWTSDVTLAPMAPAAGRRVMAILEAVNRSMGTCYLYDPLATRPAADPTGTLLGAATPVIAALNGATGLSIGGLPAGYVLSAGDVLAFDYGNPARRAFHRLAGDGVAGAGGTTPMMEVSPFIRPGAAVGAAVMLIRAAIKCMIVPGSLKFAPAGSIAAVQISFSVIQKP